MGNQSSKGKIKGENERWLRLHRVNKTECPVKGTKKKKPELSQESREKGKFQKGKKHKGQQC